MVHRISISIIIPTLNEASNLSRLIPHLQQHGRKNLREIIVVDGESTDDTLAVAMNSGADQVLTAVQGRAKQMNAGAKAASGNVLYFVHADALPPSSFVKDIVAALEDGFPAGCYRFRFDSSRRILKINAWFTRFDRKMCRGGDQTLFVTRQLFDSLNGFQEDFVIMEDYDFIRRARAENPFKIIPKEVLVSARKYDENSYLRVNLANLYVFTLYRWGASPEYLHKAYLRLIKHPKDVRKC